VSHRDPTHVYWLYDDAGTLLYVGQTVDIDGRMKRHKSTSPWLPQVARVRTVLYGSVVEARRIEAEAIRSERPVHNLQHTGRPYKPRVTANEVLAKLHAPDPLIARDLRWLLGKGDHLIHILDAIEQVAA
jgi:predicted GIY-YIG superfamily endonuclease